MIGEVVPAPDERWTIEGHENVRTDDITLACYIADELHQTRGRLNESPKQNWVDKVGGLPDYIDRIAVHLVGKGMERGHAIATAVNAAKKMCATGDLNLPGHQDVNPGSRAEACSAVQEWEAKKAQSHAGSKK